MDITIRPYQLSDVDHFMEWACDDEVVRFTRLQNYESKEDALDYLKLVVLPHPWCRAVCLEGRPVGLVLFKPGSGEGNHKGELGYALGSKYWGQGIMTMVVKMAISIVFKQFPNIVRIEALADVENKASLKVLQKVGFVKEGVMRKYLRFKGEIVDVVVYSILSTDLNSVLISV